MELEDVCESQEWDTKVAGKKITIGARLDIACMVKAAVDFVFSKADRSKKETHATGDWGAASATGYHGAASATGYHGAASATGDWGAASATGNQGAASATGDHGAASATGYQGAASATGKDSVALAAGYQGKAKGAKGCVICCVERGDWNGETYPILAAKAAIVDGETIKADTWYTLKDGEFVEAENG